MNNQQGVIAVLVGIAMLTLISFAALAVDIGYILTTKSELQNIADAAALAAAGKLGDIYDRKEDLTSGLNDKDRTDIVAEATSVAASNWVVGKTGIIIKDGDIKIGTWNGNSFDPSGIPFTNAVEIVAWMDNTTANGPISTFFAKLFGVDSVRMKTSAIAALSGIPLSGGQLPDINDPVKYVRGDRVFPYSGIWHCCPFRELASIPSLVK